VTPAPALALADGVIERVATTEHPQPNLAIVRMPTPERVLDGASFVVVADELNDPGNLGTILRSAEAAGIEAVVLTPGSVDPYNPKVVRASAGALFHVRVVAASLDEVRAAGLRLVGTSSHLGSRHTAADWSGRVAIVLGSEAHGLADNAPVDAWVRIEHNGRAESLNVAMAATLLVFTAAEQRRPPTAG
jgi:TrmH family RNA methyltransferase